MTKKLKIIVATIIALALPALVVAAVFIPSQGGTGIGSVTSTDVGKVISVSSTNPFLYKLIPTGSGFTTTTILGLDCTTYTLTATSTVGISTSTPCIINIGPSTTTYSGQGTANQLARFTAFRTLGDSRFTDDGVGNISVNVGAGNTGNISLTAGDTGAGASNSIFATPRFGGQFWVKVDGSAPTPALAIDLSDNQVGFHSDGNGLNIDTDGSVKAYFGSGGNNVGNVVAGSWGGNIVSTTKGGTSTSTYIRGLVIASGTNPFVTISGTDGKVLTASSSAPYGFSFESVAAGGGITSLNAQTGATQTFATSGPALSITSSGDVHTWSLPTSTASVTGVLTGADWTIFNNKVSATRNVSTTVDGSIRGGGDLSSDRFLFLALGNNAAQTCGGTDKVSSISPTGTITCTTDVGGSGSPGGSDTQIQFNLGGVFGGDANFTWATSSKLLTVNGSSTVTGNLNYNSLITKVGVNGEIRQFNATTTTDLSRGDALLRAMSTATSGDSFYLSANTFDMATGTIDLSLGGTGTVHLHGSGKYSTVIKSGATSTIIIHPGNNSETTDLSIIGTAAAPFFSLPWGARTGTSDFTDVLLKNVYISADTDAIYIDPSAGGHTYSGTIVNVTAESNWDVFVLRQDAGTWNIYDSFFRATSDVGVNSGNQTRVIYTPAAQGGTINIFNSQIIASGGLTQSYGVFSNNAPINMYGGTVSTTGSGTVYDLTDNNEVGAIRVTANTVYDTSKTFGTIGKLDSNQIIKSIQSGTINFGLGTTTPITLLDVNGTSTIRGGLFLGKGSINALISATDISGSSKTFALPNLSGTFAVSSTAPITLSSLGVIGCATATGSVTGCLSSTDWTTFNNKQAALTAGRSLTLTGATLDTDAELYTHMASMVLSNPVTGDSGLVQHKFATAVTISRISCSTDTGTATIQLDERAEATPNTAGTDVMSSALVCDSNTEATTTFANATVAADVPLNLDIDAVASTPTKLRIHIDYAADD